MKNYIKLSVIVSLLIFISSCGDKYTNPQIKFENNSQTLIFSGSNEVNIKITFEAEALIEAVKLSKPTTSAVETIDITTMMGITYGQSSIGLSTADYYLKVSNTELNTLKQAGKFPLNYSFTLTDQQGSEVSAIYTVSMPQTNSYLKVKSGYIYHEGSTLTNSWDLVNDIEVSKSGVASAQSIYNNDMSDFAGNWISKNGTTFVKAETKINYDTFTDAEVISVYSTGPILTQVYPNPQTENIYIAKNGNNYYVIKVTNISPYDGTCACSKPGKLTFEYKKK